MLEIVPLAWMTDPLEIALSEAEEVLAKMAVDEALSRAKISDDEEVPSEYSEGNKTPNNPESWIPPVFVQRKGQSWGECDRRDGSCEALGSEGRTHGRQGPQKPTRITLSSHRCHESKRASEKERRIARDEPPVVINGWSAGEQKERYESYIEPLVYPPSGESRDKASRDRQKGRKYPNTKFSSDNPRHQRIERDRYRRPLIDDRVAVAEGEIVPGLMHGSDELSVEHFIVVAEGMAQRQ